MKGIRQIRALKINKLVVVWKLPTIFTSYLNVMSKRHLFSSKLFTLMDNDWQKGADNPKWEWKIEKEKSILVLESVFSAYLPSQLCRAWANICVHVQSLSTQKPAWIRKVLWRCQFTNKVRTDCHSTRYRRNNNFFSFTFCSALKISID